jgi:hypothetical protein
MAVGSNDNWGQCPKCGSPVLINPNTGRPEQCATCKSMKSRFGLFVGGYWIILGLAVVALIGYFCLRMFNQ